MNSFVFHSVISILQLRRIVYITLYEIIIHVVEMSHKRYGRDQSWDPFVPIPCGESSLLMETNTYPVLP